MKIIKSIPVIILCLCATTTLFAQEVKAEIGKPIEPKQPSTDNRPSPAPVLKPQNDAVPTEGTKAEETPSPVKKEETKTKHEEPKQITKTIDDGTATNPKGAENVKALKGKAEKPKQIALMPNSNDHSARPLTATKPAILKEQ